MLYQIPDYTNLVSTYQTLMSREEDSKWQQGDFLVETIEAVFPDVKRDAERKKFFDEFAEAVGQNSTTLRMRYRTANVFRPASRALDKSWYIHSLCARQEPKSYELTGVGEEWLQLALEQGWGQTNLELALKTNLEPMELRVQLAEKSLDKIVEEMRAEETTQTADCQVVWIDGEQYLKPMRPLVLMRGEIVTATVKTQKKKAGV